MGEANEMCQKMRNSLTYRAYKAADGNMRVHIYNFDKFEKEYTLDEFQREYNITK